MYGGKNICFSASTLQCSMSICWSFSGVTYHYYIIEKSLRDKYFEVAQIEIKSL